MTPRRVLLPGVLLAAALAGCASAPRDAAAPRGVALDIPGSPGRFVAYDAFPSRHAQPRRVIVWLPPGYDSTREPYAVLYMHDARNLFDPRTSMGGQPWAVDRHLANLIAERRVQPTIVVGVDNTPLRSREYAPAAAVASLPAELQPQVAGGPPLSDGYVRFLVEELKPFVDAHYRTRPDREHTFVMGSSMGGLISLYALAVYPGTFGGAGCLSTHWPITTDPALLQPASGPAPDPRVARIAAAYRDWLREHLPRAGAHRLYFDHGTEHLDSLYAPFQAHVDALLRDAGYRDGVDSLSRVYPGASHDETAWRSRLDVPLEFLLRER